MDVTASRSAGDPGVPFKSPPRMFSTAPCVFASAPLAVFTADDAVRFLSDPRQSGSGTGERAVEETHEVVDRAAARLPMLAIAALTLLKMSSWFSTQARLSLFAASPPPPVTFALVPLDDDRSVPAAELVPFARLVLFDVRAVLVTVTAEDRPVLVLVLLAATLVLSAVTSVLFAETLVLSAARLETVAALALTKPLFTLAW